MCLQKRSTNVYLTLLFNDRLNAIQNECQLHTQVIYKTFIPGVILSER